MKISDTPRQSNYANISITPSGAILVVYQDNRFDGSDVFYSYSRDGGNTFSAGKKVSDDQTTTRQEYIDCAIDASGNRYVVWQDSRRDMSDIYFSKDTSALQLVLPDIVTPILPVPNSTVSSFDRFSWEPPANLNQARHVVYDLRYQKEGESLQVIPDITNAFFRTQLTQGKYLWSVNARSLVGVRENPDMFTFTIQSPTGVDRITPDAFSLSQNYPNPFSKSSSIRYTLSSPARASGQTEMNRDEIVHFKVHDLFGREILDLSDRTRNNSDITIESSQLPSPGVYYYTLQTGKYSLTKRMLVVR